MYKINKISKLNYILLRGNCLTKKLSKNITKQTLIFLRAPKHFNIGKHKVSSFVNFKTYKYIFDFILPTNSLIKNKSFFYRLFTICHKLNLNYNITSIRINTKLKIKW